MCQSLMFWKLEAGNLKYSNRCQSSAIGDGHFQLAMVITKISTIFLSFYIVPDSLGNNYEDDINNIHNSPPR